MPTADEMRNLGESILILQRDRAVTIAGLKAETSAMKTDTAAFVGELAAGTAARKSDVASQLDGYATEMSQARDAWREHLGAPPPRPRKVKAAPPPPKVEAAPPPPKVEAAPRPRKVEAAPPSPPPVKKVTPDDLALIRGIGASMEARLNGMEITTYADLAEASPDMVREKLGDFGKLAKVEEWIAQAKERI